MGNRDVAAGAEHSDAGARFGHADRLEDPGADEVVPLHAGSRLDHRAGGNEQHVVVGVGAAETGRRRDVAELPEDFFPAPVGVEPEQVPGAEGEAAPVGEQVPDGELMRHIRRAAQAEPGEIVGDRIVPAELAVVHQDAERRGGDRLGIGGHLEERVLVDLRRISHPADAPAGGKDDLAVPDHADGGPGLVEALERGRDVGIDVLGRGLRREGAQGDRQQQGGKAGTGAHAGVRWIGDEGISKGSGRRGRGWRYVVPRTRDS